MTWNGDPCPALCCRVTRPKLGSGLLRLVSQSLLSGWSSRAILGLSSLPSSVCRSVWKSKRDLWLRFLQSTLGRFPGEGEVCQKWNGGWAGVAAGGGIKETVIHRCLFSSDGTWLASALGHTQNAMVVNSPQTIVVWHLATPFTSNKPNFREEPQTWEIARAAFGRAVPLLGSFAQVQNSRGSDLVSVSLWPPKSEEDR